MIRILFAPNCNNRMSVFCFKKHAPTSCMVSKMAIMVTKGKKAYRVATIKNELGLHARTAAQIAAIAKNSGGNVWLKKDEQEADASSIIDILTLACEKSTKITIIIEDSGDIDILNAIADLVDSGFGE